MLYFLRSFKRLSRDLGSWLYHNGTLQHPACWMIFVSVSFFPVRLWALYIQNLEHIGPCSSPVLGLVAFSANQSRARVMAHCVDFGDSLGSNLTCSIEWDVHQAGYVSFLCLSLFTHLVRITIVSPTLLLQWSSELMCMENLHNFYSPRA